MLSFFTSSLLHKPERLVLKGGRWAKVPLRVRVGYFHHPKLGHTLIDTGYSAYVTDPRLSSDRFLALYRKLLGPSLVSSDPMTDGLARLGITREMISTIIVTHFHADHVGGLKNFPKARVVCSEPAWTVCRDGSDFGNARHGLFKSLLPDDLAERLDFVQTAAQIEGPLDLGPCWDITGDGSVLAIDLPGHLDGHIGMCFPKFKTPCLYAVDAQWMRQAVTEDRVPGAPAKWVHRDGQATFETVRKVQKFVQAGGDLVLCHDPYLHAFDIDRDV